MSRVFVLERSKHDASTAVVYGELITLFPRMGDRPSMWHSTAFGSRVIDELRQHAFDPMKDFVLLCGSLLALSVAVAAIAAEFGAFNALAFNARDDVRDYEPVVLGETSLVNAQRSN